MPVSAPSGRLTPWIYDGSTVRADLDALDALLASRTDLSERDDLLPFFRAHPHLLVLMGSYNPRLAAYDRLGVEVSLFGQFTADAIVGDSTQRAYTLFEFEDAREGSMFVRRGRHRTEWSPRAEHGLSQLVDWLWLLDDQQHTLVFEEMFGPRPVTARVVLVIGHDSGVSHADRRRLEWRRDNVVINSQHLHCCTFDELLRDLRWEARLDQWPRQTQSPK